LKTNQGRMRNKKYHGRCSKVKGALKQLIGGGQDYYGVRLGGEVQGRAEFLYL